jgi:catechol 2,3-dioxygenase-like lactoylglutathione lyase family enzyme
MIVGIHHVAVGVSDIERAVKFYSEAFGFEVVQRSEFDSQELVDRAIGLTNENGHVKSTECAPRGLGVQSSGTQGPALTAV